MKKKRLSPFGMWLPWVFAGLSGFVPISFLGSNFNLFELLLHLNWVNGVKSPFILLFIFLLFVPGFLLGWLVEWLVRRKW